MLAATLALIAGFCPAPSSGQTTSASAVQVHQTLVAVGDIADLSCLPKALKANLTSLPVTKFGEGQTRKVFTAGQLHDRVHALAPGTALGEPHDRGEMIELSLVKEAAPTRLAPAVCVRAVRALQSDVYPVPADWQAAPCGDRPAKAWVYDRGAGVMRLSRPLKIGDVVLAAPRFALAGVQPGQSVVLETTVGPVRVQRSVQAIQPARPGQSFFAKAADGTVLSVPYPSATP